MVYFLYSKKIGLTKIGYTKDMQNLKHRIRDAAWAGSLEVFHLVETDNYKQLEFDIHKKYRNLWVTGEWYDLDASF